MQDYAVWQQLTPDELDLSTRVLVRLGLIQRRRIWTRQKTREYMKVGAATFEITSSLKPDTVKPSWEYKVTRPGELVIRVLERLKR